MKTVNLTTALLALMSSAILVSPQAAAAGSREKKEAAAIEKLLQDGCAGFVAKNLDAAMAPYSRDVFLFDLAPPQHSDYQHLREANGQLIEQVANTPTCSYRDMYIKVYGNNAYARYILPYSVVLKSGASIDVEGRGTDILEKVNGKWSIVHEHFSLPVNPVTGQAELKPSKAGQ